jgi:hypothetical protein
MDRTSNFNAVLSERASPIPPERHRPAERCGLRKRALASISAIVIGSLASPAMAASEPSTRLIRCGEQSCLQISGRRGDSAAIISINGHVVPVEGERRWRVRLPVEVVRQWSSPYARTIEVSLHDPETQRETIASVDLPIGLLGGKTELASLVISVR